MGNFCSCFRSNPEAAQEPEDKESTDPVEEIYAKAANAWTYYSDRSKPNDRLEAVAEAVALYDQALKLAPTGHPRRNDILLGQIFALLEQSERRPERSALETMERYLGELEAQGGDVVQALVGYAITARLGKIYYALYSVPNQTPPADPHDFDHYVSNCLKAVRYSEEPETQIQLLLAVAYQHYQRRHLQNALECYQKAKAVCPYNRLDLLLQISRGLYTVHQERYWGETGSRNDLENALTECKGQLKLHTTSDGRAHTLVDLAHGIWVLSERHSTETSFTERVRNAIGYCREALALVTASPGGGEIRARARITLAHTLASRHGRPTVENIDEAIGLYHKATEESPGDADLLNNLAGAIWFRCEEGGEADSGTTLQSALDLYQETLTISTDRKLNSSIANNIAAIYIKRASSSDQNIVEDLQMAKQSYLKAAELCVDENDKVYFNDQAERVEFNIGQIRSGKGSGASFASGTSRLAPGRRSTVRQGSI